MADDETVAINAMIEFYESKRLIFQAEIEQIDLSLEQLRRWRIQSPPQSTAEKTAQPVTQRRLKLKWEEGKTVRDIVLAHVGEGASFKLLKLADEIIASGAIKGDRSAVYGTITSMLRRNPHIFAKVRRGIWRVKNRAEGMKRPFDGMTDDQIRTKVAEELFPEAPKQSDEEKSETPVH